MIERIPLTRPTLVRCWTTAKKRDAIKLTHTDRRVSSRPGFEIHFDGLRAEVALEQYVDQPGLVDFSVQIHGDGGSDMVLGGLRIQVKASIYDPPLLRFDIEGSQTFKADIAVLAFVPLAPKSADAEWCQNKGYVNLIGWITREDFFARARVIDFGHGDRLVVGAESLQAMSILRDRFPRRTDAERAGHPHGFVGYDKDDRFVHYCHCGKDAGLGHGVRLAKGQLGTWYCAEHNPPPKEQRV